MRVFTEKPTDTQAKKVTNFYLKNLHKNQRTSLTMDGEHLYLTLSLNMSNEWEHSEVIELCIPIQKVKDIFELLREEIKHSEMLKQWCLNEQNEKIQTIVIGRDH